METKRKIMAYIKRENYPNIQLLVLEHKNKPGSDWQVPGAQSEMT